VQIGIGVPTMIPGTPGTRLAQWSTAAEEAGFASLNVTDRMTYENYEPFTALGVAATVTSSIQLRTAIVLGPLRHPTHLAKAALTVDRISEGRFELGLGVGSRPDDYASVDVDIHRRGQLLDEQVAELVRIWGEGPDRTRGAIGPEPYTAAGPRLMFGGSSAATWRRVTQYGAGWMCGHGGPDIFRSSTSELDQVWSESGRSGRPRRLMAFYFALGDQARERVEWFIESYFGFAPFKANLLAATPSSPEQIREVTDRFAAAGCDELVFFPCKGDLDQVELLAEAVPAEMLGAEAAA
jgi:alkanesulfonate monooxygenase SsuD/methylene tetrahydromethanopterin reductase-like flavin-dependent oxidoreductase (luciferase family)